MLKKWENLPQFMKCDEVKTYYDGLKKKRISLIFKRAFDISMAFILMLVLSLPMLVIAVSIAMDSKGGVFYRQERVTMYGKVFRIHKFRTMVYDADKIGSVVTTEADNRITRTGRILRKYRLDEIPQLIDILQGNMSFVGTRPEVVKYVKEYTMEMNATLLMPAGITSEASIRYKDEAKLLNGEEDVDYIYMHQVLPEKMRYNLQSIRDFGFWRDIGIMFRTVLAVFSKN